MRRFRLLVLRRIARAPLRAAMTVATIAAGVSLAVSITILVASIDRSLADFGRGLAGPAPLQVTGATIRGGIPVEAVERAATVAGVEEVVPLVVAPARAQAAGGAELVPTLVIGADCRIEALLGPLGCTDDLVAGGRGPLAVGSGLAGLVGPEGVLRTDHGPVGLAGTPVVGSLDLLGDGQVVVLGLADAQAGFTRTGQVDVAYVLTEPGAVVDEVRARLAAELGPHLPVLAGDATPGGGQLLGAALAIFSLLGVFALGVGAVLVSNTAAMSLEARRRELAVLGALGGRRWTIGGATVAEMALLGAVGGAVGAVGGSLVARPIVASFSEFTEAAIGVPLRTHIGTGAVVTGMVLGAGLGAASSLLPVRRATGADVAAELSGRDASEVAAPPRLGRRLGWWLAVAAAGAAGCWLAQRNGALEPWQATLVTPSFLAVLLGLLFASAAAAPLLAGRLAGPVAATASASLRLGVAAARRDHRRTGVLVVAVGAAVVTAFVTEGSSASARASVEASFARGGPAVDVATVPPGEGAGPGVGPQLLEALAGVPGAGEVVVGRFVVTTGGEDPVAVQAIAGNLLAEHVLDGVADPARLAEGEVLVGAGLARARGVRAGSEVRLVTPSGAVAVPVQGVWEDGNNVGVNVTMSPELMDELYGPQPPAFVGVRPAEGVSEAELAAAIEAAGLDPELRTRASAVVAADIADEIDGQFVAFRVMQQALLVVLFVAVLSSLLLAGVQRRRELGLLGAVGAEPRGLAGVLLVEGAVVAIVGVAVSLLIGPAVLWSFNQVLPFVVGFRNPLTFDWASLVVTSIVATVVVLAGAAVPARRAARIEVLDALRSE